MQRRLLICSVLLLIAVLGCSASNEGMDPVEARAQFLSFAKDNFRGDFDTMARAFRNSFKEGDPVSEYDEILKTAEKLPLKGLLVPNWLPNAETLYKWSANDGKDGATFEVYVGGGPPKVLKFRVRHWLS
jgi:hypothetical protein